MKQHRHSIKGKGFTMLELLITLAVIAVVAGIAGPSFKDTINRSKVSSHRENLANALQYARSEAIKRKGNVIICASADAATCNGGNNWHQGWVVFADVNGNGTPQNTERLQRHYTDGDLATGNVTLGQVRYTASGLPDQGGDQTIGICDPNSVANGRAVRIGATGTVRREGSAQAGC